MRTYASLILLTLVSSCFSVNAQMLEYGSTNIHRIDSSQLLKAEKIPDKKTSNRGSGRRNLAQNLVPIYQ